MIVMLPIVFMARPARRPLPTPAEIAAAERGRLRELEERTAREAAERHTANTNRMAKLELRLKTIEGAAKNIVRQMHCDILGPEIGQTAYGQKKGWLSGYLSGYAKRKPIALEASSISPDEAKKRAALAKADAEGLVRAHNAFVAEWNRISDALGRDPALHKQPISLDALVDLIVEEDKAKYEQPPYDKLHVDFEAIKRRLKNL